MSCEEISRELVVPTGAYEPKALDEHVSACPSCADWLDRSRQFDRLWEASRPVEPSYSTWGRLWAKVTEAADQAQQQTRPMPEQGRSLLFALAALAQAAVLVVAAVALLRTQGLSPAVRPVAVVEHDEALAGTPLFICLDVDGNRVPCEDRLNTPEMLKNIDLGPLSVAWDMEFLGSMEGAE
jgi:hypothetical protein